MSESDCNEAKKILDEFGAAVSDKDVKLPKEKVLPSGNFISMWKTNLAWVLAFPALFPPVFEDNKLKINGDFTLKQDGQLKEKDVLFSEWAEWILWSNNGRHAGHPTFSLVLNSELT